MNNHLLVIVIIIIIFIFSGDKNSINKLFDNKLVILLSIIYFIYNNINLMFLLIIILSIILSNQKIRQILYDRYEKHINIGKNKLKILLDIESEPKNENIKQDDENIDKLINNLEEESDNEENFLEIDENNENNNELEEEDDNNEELQKLIDEINI